MGPLTLPTQGPVYLDANGFIYSVGLVEPYRTLLEPMWQQARAGEFDVASSDSTSTPMASSKAWSSSSRTARCLNPCGSRHGPVSSMLRAAISRYWKRSSSRCGRATRLSRCCSGRCSMPMRLV